MGEVYRARDSRLGRDVAVKVLPEHLASDAQALKRFQREARAVAALSHPNILALYDVGSEQGISYVVTELLEGENLRACLTQGSFSRPKAIEVPVAPRRGPSARPLPRLYAPRPQARKHLPHRRRRDQDPRLRPGALYAGLVQPSGRCSH